MLPIQLGLYFFIVRNVRTHRLSKHIQEQSQDRFRNIYNTQKETLTSRTVNYSDIYTNLYLLCVEVARGHHSLDAMIISFTFVRSCDQLKFVTVFFFIQQTRNAEVSKYLSSIKQNARFSPCDRFFSDISCTSLKVKKEIKRNSLRHAKQAKTAKYKRCELNRVEHLQFQKSFF